MMINDEPPGQKDSANVWCSLSSTKTVVYTDCARSVVFFRFEYCDYRDNVCSNRSVAAGAFVFNTSR